MTDQFATINPSEQQDASSSAVTLVSCVKTEVLSDNEDENNTNLLSVSAGEEPFGGWMEEDDDEDEDEGWIPCEEGGGGTTGKERERMVCLNIEIRGNAERKTHTNERTNIERIRNKKKIIKVEKQTHMVDSVKRYPRINKASSEGNKTDCEALDYSRTELQCGKGMADIHKGKKSKKTISMLLSRRCEENGENKEIHRKNEKTKKDTNSVCNGSETNIAVHVGRKQKVRHIGIVNTESNRVKSQNDETYQAAPVRRNEEEGGVKAGDVLEKETCDSTVVRKVNHASNTMLPVSSKRVCPKSSVARNENTKSTRNGLKTNVDVVDISNCFIVKQEEDKDANSPKKQSDKRSFQNQGLAVSSVGSKDVSKGTNTETVTPRKFARKSTSKVSREMTSRTKDNKIVHQNNLFLFCKSCSRFFLTEDLFEGHTCCASAYDRTPTKAECAPDSQRSRRKRTSRNCDTRIRGPSDSNCLKKHQEMTMRDSVLSKDEGSTSGDCTVSSGHNEQKPQTVKNQRKIKGPVNEPEQRNRKPQTNNSHLKDHKRMHTGEKPWPCSSCNAAYQRKATLQLHEWKKHDASKPAHIPKGRDKKKTKTINACLECGSCFKKKTDLQRHQLIHTGEKPFACTLCSTRFNRKSSLDYHMGTHRRLSSHVDVNFKSQVCEKCGKAYSRRFDLESHVKLVHTGQRDFVCETCGLGFVKAQSLRAHERLHTDSKPYVCGTCGHRSNHSSDLKKHIRVHTGEKPYGCIFCKKAFKQSTLLTAHLTAVHNEVRNVQKVDKN